MIESLTGKRMEKAPTAGILHNHVRVFASFSPYWNGAVASVYPCKGQKVYGAIVEITPEQLQRIDEYEGGWYRKVKRKIQLRNGTHVYCILYEKIDNYFERPPSERYINSIKTTLAEARWPTDTDPITVHGVFPAQNEAKDVLAVVVNK